MRTTHVSKGTTRATRLRCATLGAVTSLRNDERKAAAGGSGEPVIVPGWPAASGGAQTLLQVLELFLFASSLERCIVSEQEISGRGHHGERSEDQEVLLPWEGMQEAHPSQGDAVQEGKGQPVRPRKEAL